MADAPKSGVTYHRALEEIFVALWAGYRPDEYFKLDVWFRAQLIGAYRCKNQIDAVTTQAAVDAAKKKKS